MEATDRREIDHPPQLTKRSWEDVAPELEEYLSKQHDQELGLPAGFNNVTPNDVQISDDANAGDPGDPACGWMSACAQPSIQAGVPDSVGGSPEIGIVNKVARADHKHDTVDNPFDRVLMFYGN